MSYSDFALFYDQLQKDVEYSKRTDYLLKLFEKYDRLPTLMLDLACGTGGFSVEIAQKGIDVIGVDPSVDMLGVARDKCYQKGINMLLLCQSASELDLYGTVDGAICCLDSINHIVDEEELQKSFDKVSLFLEKDRLFIFDINTMYKHQNVLSGKTFVREADEVFCVWRNSDCTENGMVDIRLDFFSENENGTYNHFVEEFSERAYSDETLQKMCNNAGLEVVAVLGDLSENSPTGNEERIIYVTRKRS